MLQAAVIYSSSVTGSKDTQNLSIAVLDCAEKSNLSLLMQEMRAGHLQGRFVVQADEVVNIAAPIKQRYLFTLTYRNWED